MKFSQLASLVFLITGIVWIYTSTRMLYQSKRQEKEIVWYKRPMLTKGMYFLLLGVGLIIIESVNISGVPAPFGNVGGFIMFILALSMVLFGVLSARNKPQKDRTGQRS